MAKVLTYDAFISGMTKFKENADDLYLKAADLGEYAIEAQATPETGYLATYQLFKTVGSGAEAVKTAAGAKINVPKDYLVKSATLETCTTADTPVAGYEVGDKYIDFTVNTKDGDGTDSHFYINVKDLVDDYSNGNGIDLNNGVFSVKIDTANANGLSVGASGVALAPVVASVSGAGGSNGAMTASDKEKLDNADVTPYTAGNGILIMDHSISARVDGTNANGLTAGANGIALAAVVASTSGAGGSNGAMTATDKEKLDGITEATTAEVESAIEALFA